MKSVKDCPHGHCVLHSLPFRRFKEEELREELTEVLAEDYRDNDYYKTHYPNWQALNEEYRAILAMLGNGPIGFIPACERLMALQESQKSFIRHDLYLDLEGGVAEFVPCCC